MQRVKLKTGLRRGNITAVANEIVEVNDGLAARLIDNGQAEAVKGGSRKKGAKKDSGDPNGANDPNGTGDVS